MTLAITPEQVKAILADVGMAVGIGCFAGSFLASVLFEFLRGRR